MENLKAVNKRLVKKYGITLDQYNVMLEQQDGICKICGSAPKTRRLAVDHDHKVAYFKVVTFKEIDSWFAFIIELGISVQRLTRNSAIQAAREQAKSLSVRGLLCVGCNTGLRKFRDNSKFLMSAAVYLEEYKARHNVKPVS